MKKYIVTLCFVLIGASLLVYQNCSNFADSPMPSNTLGSTGASPAPSPMTPGQAFFTNTILPMENSRCISCHNDPRFGGTGPLTIYNYAYMQPLMAQGPSAVNNPLINKVQNIISHMGGNMCTGGLYATPCSDFISWYTTEITVSSTGIAGTISYMDVYGTANGWAQDSNHPTNAITVYFYADGPVGTGVAIGSVVANQTGLGQANGHSFTFKVPSTYADGKQHSLYAYGVSAASGNLLPGAPKIYYAYTPRAAGQTYFNNTLLPKLNTCVACHGNLTYTDRYAELIYPPPDQGGAALNNTLINKASNSIPHSGGNICGTKNSSPCLEMQQWWSLEFN